MKKIQFILLSIIVFMLVNIYFYYDTYKDQLTYHRQTLYDQTEITGSEIEWTISQFQSELNYILFTDNIAGLFDNQDIKSAGIEKFKLFYSKYYDLIEGIQIIDKEFHVLSIYKNNQNKFLSDYYISQQNVNIYDKEKLVIKNEISELYQPFFKSDSVYGNVIVSINISEFIQSEFARYNQNNRSFQWIISDNSVLVHTHPARNISFKEINEIYDNIELDNNGFLSHDIEINNKNIPVITAYYPISLLNRKIGIAFSLTSKTIINNVFNKGIYITALSLLLVLIVFLVLKKNSDILLKSENQKVENSYLQLLFNAFPGGIITTNTDNTIRKINNTAAKLLDIKNPDIYQGKSIYEIEFLNDPTQKSNTENVAFEKNRTLQLPKGVVIFKNENLVQFPDHSIVIHLLVDITSIEKSRKYANAANTAKSEFLAKMTHEIRTPMSGIIGMADALANEDLPDYQREYVDIVKKSANLLMTIINDILDYSKIEAGKMMLEEIPFKLSEEIKYSIELFRPLAEGKNIQIITEINENVPDNIVGDPYRLRQVISNLVSNAVKFTNEGEIVVRVSLEERYNQNISLQFDVEDTGIGLSNAEIDKIFTSYSQAGQSVARKFGGTGLGTSICKQLVTLMNGEIWVESPAAISKNPKYPGSKFSFTIEAYIDQKLDKNILSDDITAPEDLNIIIIQPKSEDSTLTNVLTKKGYSIDVVDYKSFKIDQFNEFSDYSLMIFYDTTEFDGFSFAHELNSKRITSQLRVILLGKNDQHGNYIQSKKLGIDTYLIEPYDHKDIEYVLKEFFPNLESTYDDKEILRKDLKIIIAEDNIFNQKVAKTIFKNIGYDISIASNGTQLLEMIEESHYDVVFTDLQMPEKDGWEVTKELREKGFTQPIIAMTATLSNEIKKDAIKSGMNDYITKPFEIKTIRNILIKYSLDTNLYHETT